MHGGPCEWQAKMKQTFPTSSALECLVFLFAVLVAIASLMALYKCAGPIRRLPAGRPTHLTATDSLPRARLPPTLARPPRGMVARASFVFLPSQRQLSRQFRFLRVIEGRKPLPILHRSCYSLHAQWRYTIRDRA